MTAPRPLPYRSSFVPATMGEGGRGTLPYQESYIAPNQGGCLAPPPLRGVWRPIAPPKHTPHRSISMSDHGVYPGDEGSPYDQSSGDLHPNEISNHSPYGGVGILSDTGHYPLTPRARGDARPNNSGVEPFAKRMGSHTANPFRPEVPLAEAPALATISGPRVLGTNHPLDAVAPTSGVHHRGSAHGLGLGLSIPEDHIPSAGGPGATTGGPKSSTGGDQALEGDPKRIEAANLPPNTTANMPGAAVKDTVNPKVLGKTATEDLLKSNTSGSPTDDSLTTPTPPNAAGSVNKTVPNKKAKPLKSGVKKSSAEKMLKFGLILKADKTLKIGKELDEDLENLLGPSTTAMNSPAAGFSKTIKEGKVEKRRGLKPFAAKKTTKKTKDGLKGQGISLIPPEGPGPAELSAGPATPNIKSLTPSDPQRGDDPASWGPSNAPQILGLKFTAKGNEREAARFGNEPPSFGLGPQKVPSNWESGTPQELQGNFPASKSTASGTAGVQDESQKASGSEPPSFGLGPVGLSKQWGKKKAKMSSPLTKSNAGEEHSKPERLGSGANTGANTQPPDTLSKPVQQPAKASLFPASGAKTAQIPTVASSSKTSTASPARSDDSGLFSNRAEPTPRPSPLSLQRSVSPLKPNGSFFGKGRGREKGKGKEPLRSPDRRPPSPVSPLESSSSFFGKGKQAVKSATRDPPSPVSPLKPTLKGARTSTSGPDATLSLSKFGSSSKEPDQAPSTARKSIFQSSGWKSKPGPEASGCNHPSKTVPMRSPIAVQNPADTMAKGQSPVEPKADKLKSSLKIPKAVSFNSPEVKKASEVVPPRKPILLSAPAKASSAILPTAGVARKLSGPPVSSKPSKQMLTPKVKKAEAAKPQKPVAAPKAPKKVAETKKAPKNQETKKAPKIKAAPKNAKIAEPGKAAKAKPAKKNKK